MTSALTYDALRRPAAQFVRGHDAQTATIEVLVETNRIRRELAKPAKRTTSTRVGFGSATQAGHRHQRRLRFQGQSAAQPAATGAGLQGNAGLVRRSPAGSRDDLRPAARPTTPSTARPTVTTPDGSVYRPTYNEANLLDKVDVNLRGAATATPFVTNIDYNAKGQRELIDYGNGARDRLTSTTPDLPPDPSQDHTRSRAEQPGLADLHDPAVVQDLRYTYDPAGNITRIEDAALQTIFHNGQQVEPVCDYTYDAIYRLIEAKAASTSARPRLTSIRPTATSAIIPLPGLPMRIRTTAGDAQLHRTVRIRRRRQFRGSWSTGANGGSWTRRYAYNEASLIESEKQSNRLRRTTARQRLNFTETTPTPTLTATSDGCMTAI